MRLANRRGLLVWQLALILLILVIIATLVYEYAAPRHARGVVGDTSAPPVLKPATTPTGAAPAPARGDTATPRPGIATHAAP